MSLNKKVVDVIKDFTQTLTVGKLIIIMVLGVVAYAVFDESVQVSKSRQFVCALENVSRTAEGLPEERC